MSLEIPLVRDILGVVMLIIQGVVPRRRDSHVLLEFWLVIDILGVVMSLIQGAVSPNREWSKVTEERPILMAPETSSEILF